MENHPRICQCILVWGLPIVCTIPKIINLVKLKINGKKWNLLLINMHIYQIIVCITSLTDSIHVIDLDERESNPSSSLMSRPRVSQCLRSAGCARHKHSCARPSPLTHHGGGGRFNIVLSRWWMLLTWLANVQFWYYFLWVFPYKAGNRIWACGRYLGAIPWLFATCIYSSLSQCLQPCSVSWLAFIRLIHHS